MISELKGKVLEILDQGFRIRSKGAAIIVATQVPGRELHLAPGDVVRVLGGLGPNDNMFYSSMVQKKRRGTWVQIRVTTVRIYARHNSRWSLKGLREFEVKSPGVRIDGLRGKILDVPTDLELSSCHALSSRHSHLRRYGGFGQRVYLPLQLTGIQIRKDGFWRNREQERTPAGGYADFSARVKRLGALPLGRPSAGNRPIGIR